MPPLPSIVEDASARSSTPAAPERVTVALEGWNADDLGAPELFRRSLETLRDQTYPIERCEVLVVCDGEAPEARRLVQQIFPHARILPLEGFTYYRCKNLALRKATGDYILLADSDVAYHPQWAENLLSALRPGVELVAGRTSYAPGFLSQTIDLCDGGMVLAQDGFTDGFYAHNVAMRRSLFETVTFHEGMGLSGGGSIEALRAELARRGIHPWFAGAARAEHPLPNFVAKRLRVGSFHLHCRRMSPGVPGTRLARVPVIAPFLVTAGVLAKTWARVWRRRSEIPGGILGVPGFLLTTSFARSVELVGACAYAWAPGLVRRRAGWHETPPNTVAHEPPLSS